MICRACGAELPEQAAFCEGCGAQVTPTAPGPGTHPTPEEEKIRRWLYEMNLWKNPTAVITVFKVLALAALAPALLMLVLGIIEGDGLDALSVFVKVYGGILGALLLLLLPAYGLIALLNGGRYCVVFEMDDQGVRHTQLQKQVDRAKALGILTALAGALSASPAVMGAGLLAASKQSTYSRFQNVRSVTVNHGRRVIYLTTGDQVRNQVYGGKEEFEAIAEHVLSRVPKKAVVKHTPLRKGH